MTPNGKLDRKALPAPDLTAATTGAPPERRRKRSSAGSLPRPSVVARVGIEDNFFELGGHSLLVTRLISRIRAVFGRRAAIRSLFEAPTVAGLIERLNEAQATAGASAARRPAEIPLSFAQRRLWFLDRLEAPARPTIFRLPCV